MKNHTYYEKFVLTLNWNWIIIVKTYYSYNISMNGLGGNNIG